MNISILIISVSAQGKQMLTFFNPHASLVLYVCFYYVTCSFLLSSLTGRSSTLAHYDIYASLPTSLKKEVLVRSRTDGDYDTLQRRRALVENKSPAELSQITNFSEIPLPSRIEEWLHASHDR